jgi:acetylornithine/N-succinyldiaminopimelate aminotransferase
VSNLYRIPQAERLAQRLVNLSFADSVFFCNSGAEANEGMIKMMRKAMASAGRPERVRIICFEGAFHGRTLGTLAAGANAAYRKGFGPVPPGFDHVPLNNMNAVRAAITPETCGIILEPIQGDGGVRQADRRFLQDLRAVCDEYGILLGLDEVQSGMGRTGRLFAHEWAGIAPDVMALAKGIGGGFPLGAVLATEAVARHLTPGTHGTTFGGNPLACAAGNAVLDIITAPGFLEGVHRKAAILKQGLADVVRDNPEVFTGVRGDGLLLGLQCIPPQAEVQAACVAAGLLTLPASENVLRLTPPLIVTEAQCRQACAMIDAACSVWKQ